MRVHLLNASRCSKKTVLSKLGRNINNSKETLYKNKTKQTVVLLHACRDANQGTARKPPIKPGGTHKKAKYADASNEAPANTRGAESLGRQEAQPLMEICRHSMALRLLPCLQLV